MGYLMILMGMRPGRSIRSGIFVLTSWVGFLLLDLKGCFSRQQTSVEYKFADESFAVYLQRKRSLQPYILSRKVPPLMLGLVRASRSEEEVGTRVIWFAHNRRRCWSAPCRCEALLPVPSNTWLCHTWANSMDDCAEEAKIEINSGVKSFRWREAGYPSFELPGADNIDRGVMYAAMCIRKILAPKAVQPVRVDCTWAIKRTCAGRQHHCKEPIWFHFIVLSI